MPTTSQLHASLCMFADTGVQGATQVFPLTPVSSKAPADVVERYPHLAGCSALQLPEEAVKMVGMQQHCHPSPQSSSELMSVILVEA